MGKKPTVKSLFDDENNYKNYLEFCASTGLPYEVIESNYTLKIVSSFCNISFMSNQMTNKPFIAKSKIVKDIKETGLVVPELDKNELTYFSFSIPKHLKTGCHTIYNIDIKSAYANILRNHSLIKNKTFGYVAKLSKKDRLACIGMLAAKKVHYFMIGERVEIEITETLETENWFYFCVQRTNELMNKCKSICGNDFLFYWVDGIFFSDEKHSKKIIQFLANRGYKCSYDICTNFHYLENDKEKKIIYNKGEEKKILSLPKKNNEVDEFLIKFLQFHDQTTVIK